MLSTKLVAPISTSTNVSDAETIWGFSTPSPIDHDYTKCCRTKGVKRTCLGFCNVKNILEGNIGSHPSNCEDDFTAIVECMAAGRNHVPCCEQAQVPDVCQDMCVGAYTIQTDDVRTHISCAAYTAPTLACIAEGVNILPPQPTELSAINVTDSSFILTWSADPYRNDQDVADEVRDTPPVEKFVVNATIVR